MPTLNQQIEFGAGHVCTVVGVFTDEPMFCIVEMSGQYAAAEVDDDYFGFINEESPWRDSLIDASCDVELAIREIDAE